MHFDHYDRHTHKNSYTFFLGYEGPLPHISSKEVKVDITIKELIVFPVEERIILRGYNEYEDLPEDAIIRAYSIDEIATEKVVALLDRARNEPRDLYDIWYLSSKQYVNLADLVESIEQKWKFKGKKVTNVREEFLRKEVRLKKLWKIRLSPQITVLPEFDRVYRTVKRELGQAGLLKRMNI